MQPFQYDLRCPAAKDKSITHAAAAPSNLDAATTMRSADAELRNTIELRATASEIAAPNTDLDAKAKKKNDFEALFNRIFERKISSAKIEKICWQIIIAALMQPFECAAISILAKHGKTHFVRDFPQKVKVEDVKTKLSCETSLKNLKVED